MVEKIWKTFALRFYDGNIPEIFAANFAKLLIDENYLESTQELVTPLNNLTNYIISSFQQNITFVNFFVFLKTLQVSFKSQCQGQNRGIISISLATRLASLSLSHF